MPKDTIFVNTLLPAEDEMALRIIGGYKRMNRSELVRLAVHEFIERNARVETLPKPEGGATVPVITINPEFLSNAKLED